MTYYTIPALRVSSFLDNDDNLLTILEQRKRLTEIIFTRYNKFHFKKTILINEQGVLK